MSSNPTKNQNSESEKTDGPRQQSTTVQSNDDQSSESAHETEQTASTKRILIGSQRDDADPQLKTREPKTRESKTIRFASLNPEKVGSVLKTIDEPTTSEPDSFQPDSSEPELSEPAVEPLETAAPDEIETANHGELETASIDELESALDESNLDELSMESLLSENEPAEELEIDSRIKATVSKIHNDNVFFFVKGSF